MRNEKYIIERLKEITEPYYKEGKIRKSRPKPGSELEDWRNSKSAQTFDLTNGSITLSISQMMSLYCLSKRPQAMQHMSFYRKQHRWARGDYIPHSGDFVVFDWEGDGEPDHIGIVESCDGKTVYTIERNSHDMCKRKAYARGSSYIRIRLTCVLREDLRQ